MLFSLALLPLAIFADVTSEATAQPTAQPTALTNGMTELPGNAFACTYKKRNFRKISNCFNTEGFIKLNRRDRKVKSLKVAKGCKVVMYTKRGGREREFVSNTSDTAKGFRKIITAIAITCNNNDK